jgi:hypothetical protein
LQLDNTTKDNKNQKMMRWCIFLVMNKIFRSATMAFLRKGHTHEDIDAVFGQLALEIQNSKFNSVEEICDILMRKLTTAGVDDNSKNRSLAYKCGEVSPRRQNQ